MKMDYADTLNHLAEGLPFVKLRPELVLALGGLPQAIILSVAIYLGRNGNAFYKFKEPCKHELYKPGTSWVEVTGLTRRQFDTGLKLIGFNKNGKGNSIPKEAALIHYKTESSRLTFYEINPETLKKLYTKTYSLGYKIAFSVKYDSADSVKADLSHDKIAFSKSTPYKNADSVKYDSAFSVKHESAFTESQEDKKNKKNTTGGGHPSKIEKPKNPKSNLKTEVNPKVLFDKILHQIKTDPKSWEDAKYMNGVMVKDKDFMGKTLGKFCNWAAYNYPPEKPIRFILGRFAQYLSRESKLKNIGKDKYES